MNPEVNEITRVIYHGDKCPDGKCASWILWRHFRDRVAKKKFHIDGYVHGHNPPDVTGDVVAILDYCFPKGIILNMAKQAKRIYIFDHHASTERDLLGDGKTALPNNVITILDNNRSGSEITWDWVYPGVPRPWFLEVISDRDLFRWERPYSKLVSNALFSNGFYTWEKLEDLFLKSTTSGAIEKLIKDFCIMGSALPDQEKEIEISCSGAFLTEMTTPKGQKYKVKLLPSPRMYRSEVGNRLSQKDCDFAVMYRYDFMLDEWWMSCRASNECNIDVSEICAQFGRGGGHAKSAGFTIFGSKGDNLKTYFRILTAPPSRKDDLELLRGMGGDKGTFNHVKLADVSK